MFNLSTLSGINLQTDNYFQYTSNALAFEVKRTCVSNKTLWRFLPNASRFSMAAKKDVKINREPLFSYQNHGYSIKRLTFAEDCPCSSTDRIEVS